MAARVPSSNVVRSAILACSRRAGRPQPRPGWPSQRIRSRTARTSKQPPAAPRLGPAVAAPSMLQGRRGPRTSGRHHCRLSTFPSARGRRRHRQERALFRYSTCICLAPPVSARLRRGWSWNHRGRRSVTSGLGQRIRRPAHGAFIHGVEVVAGIRLSTPDGRGGGTAALAGNCAPARPPDVSLALHRCTALRDWRSSPSSDRQ
jgi:hypothetical protein